MTERFSGVVVDAGGGEVRILVDRDTESYPAVGQRVSVVTVERPETPDYLGDPWPTWGGDSFIQRGPTREEA